LREQLGLKIERVMEQAEEVNESYYFSSDGNGGSRRHMSKRVKRPK